MTSTITARWNERVLPINDGLYFSDGRSLSVNLTSFPPPSIEIGAPCDPEAFHRGDRDEVTPIDCLTTLRMADSAGPAGEGAHGSEGFVARLDRENALIRVLYSQTSNPFIDLSDTDDGCVIAQSSARYSLKIDVRHPVKITLDK